MGNDPHRGFKLHSRDTLPCPCLVYLSCSRCYHLHHGDASIYSPVSPPATPVFPLYSSFFSATLCAMTRSSSVSDTTAGFKPTYAGLNGRPLGILISTIATTGFLLFGYDQGVMSGIISAAPFNAYFPETLNDSVYQGFVTAIYEVGCLLGAIFILTFGDRTGRRKAVCTNHTA